MPTSVDKERALIAAEEEKIAGKRKPDERKREVVTKALERSGLLEMSPDRAKAIFEQIREVGMDEVDRRLAQ